jgi:hypothetical protein
MMTTAWHRATRILHLELARLRNEVLSHLERNEENPAKGRPPTFRHLINFPTRATRTVQVRNTRMSHLYVYALT